MTDTNTKVPYIPGDAPFSGEQRLWLGGFLAGLHSRLAAGGGAAAATPATAAAEVKHLDILFGTQTGNAETVAEDAATLARTRGFTPRLAEMDDVSMEQLAAMQNVIIVVSTYGEGEMPDNAHQFWGALSASTAPRLEALNYGVLALGDTSYDEFCQAGKLVDTRLEQLGAKRLAARVDCDVDFEDAAEAWIAATIPDAGSIAAAVPVADATPKAEKSGWGRKNPYLATTLDNRVVSGADSAKEIRHIAFDLGDSGMTYEAGDALCVMPVNNPTLVQGWLDRLSAGADTDIGGRALGDLLTTGLEIMTPSRDLIRAIEPLAHNDELSHVVGNGDKEALDAYLWGKDALDLLNLAPDLALDPAEVVNWLKPLQHRAYSISSSPKAHPGEVHLTVAAVRWMHDNRAHGGVCSTFLADHMPAGEQTGIFMSPNKSFRVPEDDSVPMIMVGPGTGIAPFRAFLEERRERGANGANWLFFGDQHRASDFIYEDEISAFSASGLLSRLDLAFSRDQAEKVYVQHRMAENGKDLFAQLEEGGYFYVCGDATRMARDVDDALHQIVATHGGLSQDGAVAYVNALKRDKRYVRDVY
ncbi:sulfite reductase flavoprotein subunit alpha [Thalassobius sp. Cn5-15]|uniref:diflavin oxidoreductase n=1 Tax=Thalassobius sp. Cn5-15 TaxID=2917763 RepID=UPI001EF2875A|nr:sulfite reductase flavoprotein subunit alpha [Thalassobius sp. Cn5-15]MCG7493266.1 sulfite reductase flavoprotein subunit alpha [Thalassobius sp. Cn5-15]